MSEENNEKIRWKKRVIKNYKEHHEMVLRLAAGLIILFFFINLILPSRPFSANENRNLAQRPSLTVEGLKDGSFFSDFASYYADQFFLRDFWMSLNYRFHHLLGEKEFSNVYIGKDGYLLGKPEEPDQEAVNRTMLAVNAFSERYPEVNTAMILVPGAASILQNKLPGNISIRDQISDIEYFQNGLSERIKKVDAVKALQDHSGEPVYYKTDHHWTSEGALYVFRSAFSVMGLDPDEVEYEEHIVSDSFQGTLASRSGDHSSRDRIQVYEPLPPGSEVHYIVNYPDLKTRSSSIFIRNRLEEKDQYTVFFGGNHPLVEIETTADSGRSLLVFKDSYANCFIQFLTPYYSRIVMVDPRYYYDDISSAMNTYGITDILYLYSADTLLRDTALADTLNAGM